jgi:rare lipoprotein A
MKRSIYLLAFLLIFISCAKKPLKVEEISKGYTEKGIASWYGNEFKGKPTASGEIFDPDKMTAAHKTLPLGTIVKVTNLENGKSANLRVNDRGPFVRGRIIDCSKRGAKELGFYSEGTAKVKIEVVKEGREKPINSPTEVIGGDKGRVLDDSFTVQVGAFSDLNNAKRFKEKLAKIYGDCYIAKFKDFYRVRLGHFKSEKEAQALLDLILKDGFEGFLTRND